MIKAATYNFEINQGKTLEKVFTINGDAVDISGYVAVMTFRKLPGSNELWKATGDQLVVEGTNRIRLKLESTDTKQFKFDTAGYDLDLVKEIDGKSPRVIPLFTGKVLLNKEYNR